MGSNKVKGLFVVPFLKRILVLLLNYIYCISIFYQYNTIQYFITRVFVNDVAADVKLTQSLGSSYEKR